MAVVDDVTKTCFLLRSCRFFYIDNLPFREHIELSYCLQNVTSSAMKQTPKQGVILNETKISIKLNLDFSSLWFLCLQWILRNPCVWTRVGAQEDMHTQNYIQLEYCQTGCQVSTHSYFHKTKWKNCQSLYPWFSYKHSTHTDIKNYVILLSCNNLNTDCISLVSCRAILQVL